MEQIEYDAIHSIHPSTEGRKINTNGGSGDAKSSMVSHSIQPSVQEGKNEVNSETLEYMDVDLSIAKGRDVKTGSNRNFDARDNSLNSDENIKQHTVDGVLSNGMLGNSNHSNGKKMETEVRAYGFPMHASMKEGTINASRAKDNGGVFYSLMEPPQVTNRFDPRYTSMPLDENRFVSMQKAMVAKTSEFLPDKEQKKGFIESYINDETNDEVPMATGGMYAQLPVFAFPVIDEVIGSQNAEEPGANNGEIAPVPDLSYLLTQSEESDDSTDLLDDLHKMAFQSQLSKTSTSSRSEDGFKKSMSRSSSQVYSDADKEYNILLQVQNSHSRSYLDT